MPDEIPDPPHPLEPGLRAQAARRRAELGAGEPAMPGPMRTQLHDEISRLHAQEEKTREERPGFLAWLFQWQRALATVSVALIVIGFYGWSDGWFSRSSAPLAKQSPPAGSPVSGESSVAQAREKELAKRSDAPANVADAEKEQATAAAAAPRDAVAAGKLEEVPKPAQPPATAAAPAASEPRSESFATKSAPTSDGLRQSFANTVTPSNETARRAAGAGAKDERVSPLLDQFEFRQSGNRVEIIDADGSVYAGEIEANKKTDRGAALAGRDQEPVGDAKQLAPKAKNADLTVSEFNFRATGVSNTLRQKVTIEGSYQAPGFLESQNAPGSAASGGVSAQEVLKSARPAPMQQNQAQTRARVVGRAQVNGRNVEVNAEATK